ncbi:hypothetical protein C2S52_009509 [Perilla frutescens var. hirtella]|nr:hypothetical protein C2S52_009509 [Perilla frutescens var. hirtella]
MKNSMKASRVSTAQVADNRQAKTLLPEHHPARVGAKPKSSRPVAARSKNHLAWYVALNTKQLERKTPRIRQIKWKCPPKLALNREWQVAAGEESQDARRTSEEVYSDDCHDDSQTPIIPIIPIEEIEAQMASDTSATVNTSQDQSVHGKSLPDRLHSLECEMIKKLMSGNGLTSKPEDEAPAPKPNTCLPSPSLTPASVVDKLANGCSEPVSKAVLSDSTPTPQAVNQSPFLPCSKAETEINKCPKLGGAGSGLHTPKAENPSPLLPCSKVEAEIKKCATKLGAMHAGSGPLTEKADNQSPFLPCSKAGTEIKKCATKLGVVRAGSGPLTPKAENQSPFLPCSKGETEIKKSASKLGGIPAGSGLRAQKAENQSPSLPCSKAVTEIKKSASKLVGMPAGSGPHPQKAENQSPSLPCSNAVTEIEKSVSKIGGMPAGSGTHPQKAENQSPSLPCSDAVTEIEKSASELGGMPAGSGPHTQKAENQSPSLPSSKAVTEIKKSASKLGVMPAGSGPHTQMAENQSPSLPCSNAVTEIKKSASKIGDMPAGSEPHTQKAENQSPSPPCSKAVTEIKKSASKLGGMLAGSGPRTSKAEKRPSPSLGLNSDRPTKKVTSEPRGPAHPRTDQTVGEQKVSALVSSTLRANEEMINRQTKKYGGPDSTGVKPVNSLNPYPSKPNMEAAKRMIHDYGARDVVARVKPMAPPIASPSIPTNMERLNGVIERYVSPDQGWRRAFIGPSPSLHALTAPAPVTNLHAFPNPPEFHYNGTGNFHPSFHPMSIPGRQSLIMHHGEIHERGEDRIWQSVIQQGIPMVTIIRTSMMIRRDGGATLVGRGGASNLSGGQEDEAQRTIWKHGDEMAIAE